jgi:hypothetical protein
MRQVGVLFLDHTRTNGTSIATSAGGFVPIAI